jgi:hypothetical protein
MDAQLCGYPMTALERVLGLAVMLPLFLLFPVIWVLKPIQDFLDPPHAAAHLTMSTQCPTIRDKAQRLLDAGPHWFGINWRFAIAHHLGEFSTQARARDWKEWRSTNGMAENA